MKKKFKETKGITLIALVLTIIVLLILAGVTIATLTGNNGILSQAQNAKKVTEYAAAEEKVKVEVMGSYSTNGNLELSKLVENLGHVGTVTKATFPVEVTVDGKSFTINDTGLVEQSGPRIRTSNLKITTVADTETEITTTSTNKPEEGTPLEISFDVSISEGSITAVDKGTLTNGKVTYDTNGTETEVIFTFTLSGVDNSTPNTVTINLNNYMKKPKLYGAQVQLNGGSPIAVKGTNTIDDNWKLFYIDDDDNDSTTIEYVHLIYGDIYPGNVQTEITSDIFIPAHNNSGNDSNYVDSINSRTNRLTLLKYLKNNSNYVESSLDSCIPIGSYTSWINLETALTGSNKVLNGKNILIQGAPNVTMWVKSWNEQGYESLGLDVIEDTYQGYNAIWLDSEKTSSKGVVLLRDSEGFDDELYFPVFKGESAAAYYMASPGGYDYESMTYANKNGLLGAQTTWITGGFKDLAVGTRPIVSIKKSDFVTLFPKISITKESY